MTATRRTIGCDIQTNERTVIRVHDAPRTVPTGFPHAALRLRGHIAPRSQHQQSGARLRRGSLGLSIAAHGDLERSRQAHRLVARELEHLDLVAHQ